MLRESFIGHNPTHFIASPVVKAFITSEIFLWSAFNSIIPLLGIFVVNNIPGGNIQLAASGYSLHLATRVVFELLSGKNFEKSSDISKIHIAITGLFITAIGFFGFAATKSVALFLMSFVIVGVGIGIASPAKNSLFSTHLDKNKETAEWGIYDALVFIFIALSTSMAGFIISTFSFRLFFIISAVAVLIAIIPYLVYLRINWKSS